jgi:phosphoserine phosphatase RsbU/P
VECRVSGLRKVNCLTAEDAEGRGVSRELVGVIRVLVLRGRDWLYCGVLRLIANWPKLPRPLLIVLAVLFAAVSLLYGVLWMYETRRPNSRVELGFNFQQAERFDESTHSIPVHDVVRDSPAERAGLRAGDRIIGVNGRRLDTSAPYDEVYARSRPGDAVEFTLARDGEKDAVVVRGVFRARPSAEANEGIAKTSAQQILASFPVFFLLIGLAVLFLKVDDPQAWLLCMLFIAFAASPDINNSPALPGLLKQFVFGYHAVFNGMLCALFYLFFALFPVRSPLGRRFPWLKWIALGVGAITIWPGWETGHTAFPEVITRWLGERASSNAFLVSRYLPLALGMVSLSQNAFLSTVPVEARRKSRVMWWSTVLGVLPIIVERSLRDFGAVQVPYWPDAMVVLVLFLYPLSFAYAVVKHRVMDIPVLLRRSARYVLVQKGFVFAVFVVAGIVLALFTRLFSGFVRTNANLGMALSSLFGIVLVWASAPVVKKITARIDRAFFRSSYDARKILQDLAEKTRTVSNSAEMAGLLAGHVREALHPKSLACYMQGDGSWLSLASGSGWQFPGTISANDARLAGLMQMDKSWDARLAGFVASTEFASRTPFEAECVVPIVGRDAGLLGVLVLGPRLSEEPYSREDRQLLNSAAGQAGIALENILMAEKMAERMEADRRAAHEMDIARDVQARLFPQVRPPMLTLEYAGTCIQVREVGGDYYDFLDMGAGRLGIVLADISGKGIAAALLMANLQANLRSQYAVALDDPRKLLNSVNRLFYENTPDDRYATLFYADYDDESQKVRYVNCGHNPPVLLRADGKVERLKATATVLGLFEKWECAAMETQLLPGDLLVIYSDGVTEAMNREDEEFGEERFFACLREARPLEPEVVVDRIVSAVQRFTGGKQTDDLTLVVARGK